MSEFHQMFGPANRALTWSILGIEKDLRELFAAVRALVFEYGHENLLLRASTTDRRSRRRMPGNQGRVCAPQVPFARPPFPLHGEL